MKRIADDLDVTTEELVRALASLPLVIAVVAGIYIGTLMVLAVLG
jgi:hypothetical protein